MVFVVKLGSHAWSQAAFIGQVALWLWLSLLALSAGMATAEASTLARARRLRALQSDIPAKCLIMPHDRREDWLYETVPSETLDVGDVVLVQAGDVIPVDGEVIDGVAEVDESAVTGESAPVIRESGGDRSAVFGGTRVLSDWLKVKVTADLGHGLFAQISELIAGARRRASRTELWLTLPLLALAVLTVAGVALIRPVSTTDFGHGPPGPRDRPVRRHAADGDGGLALGHRASWAWDGWSRVNMIAKSGAAVEAAASVDTLLLDKTGTITLGDRSVEAISAVAGDRRAGSGGSRLSCFAERRDARGPVDRRHSPESRFGLRSAPETRSRRPPVQRRDPDERRDPARRHGAA